MCAGIRKNLPAHWLWLKYAFPPKRTLEDVRCVVRLIVGAFFLIPGLCSSVAGSEEMCANTIEARLAAEMLAPAGIMTTDVVEPRVQVTFDGQNTLYQVMGTRGEGEQQVVIVRAGPRTTPGVDPLRSRAAANRTRRERTNEGFQPPARGPGSFREAAATRPQIEDRVVLRSQTVDLPVAQLPETLEIPMSVWRESVQGVSGPSVRATRASRRQEREVSSRAIAGIREELRANPTDVSIHERYATAVAAHLSGRGIASRLVRNDGFYEVELQPLAIGENLRGRPSLLRFVTTMRNRYHYRVILDTRTEIGFPGVSYRGLHRAGSQTIVIPHESWGVAVAPTTTLHEAHHAIVTVNIGLARPTTPQGQADGETLSPGVHAVEPTRGGGVRLVALLREAQEGLARTARLCMHQAEHCW